MICFHGTPFSGSVLPLVPFFKDRNFLVSMEYPSYADIVKEHSTRFILDNGAFTKWKRGKGSIDINKYIDFVSKFDTLHNYSWNFIPDIIDGSCAENDKFLNTWVNLYGVYKSVPVWHYHEPLSRLKELGQSFPIVGLGSSSEYSKIGTPAWLLRTEDIFNYYMTHIPECKLHGLRMLNKRIFTKFHYYSGDSTNVGRNLIFYQKRHRIKTRLEAAETLAKSFEVYKSLYDYSEL